MHPLLPEQANLMGSVEILHRPHCPHWPHRHAVWSFVQDHQFFPGGRCSSSAQYKCDRVIKARLFCCRPVKLLGHR